MDNGIKRSGLFAGAQRFARRARQNRPELQFPSLCDPVEGAWIHEIATTRINVTKGRHGNAGQTLKNYYEVPVDIIESAEQLVEWAMTAADR